MQFATFGKNFRDGTSCDVRSLLFLSLKYIDVISLKLNLETRIDSVVLLKWGHC